MKHNHRKLPLQNQSSTTRLSGRRQFLSTGARGVSAALLLSSPLTALKSFGAASAAITVGQVMDTFIAEVPGAPFKKTVDTLKAGDRNIVVTGIVTTMFATTAIIKKAIELKANFIIAHEPTFYNHLDETDWLKKDEVYQFKANLLLQHNMAVWRNHDYIHSHLPDGVKSKLVSNLGWTDTFNIQTNIASITPTPLLQLIDHLKSKLGITMVRYIGNVNQPCQKVLLLPGAAGGKRQIEAIMATRPDVVVCGEIAEWETAEYVRDARAKGDILQLVILGHIPSEEPGSEYMETWLKQHFSAIPVTHVPTQNALEFA